MEENELKHYGVLGMKWGVRKDRGKSSPNGRSGKKVTSAQRDSKAKRQTTDRKKAAEKAQASKIQKAKKKLNDTKNKRFTLSDAELDKALDRVKKQKQLRELTDEEVAPGKAYVTDMLKKVGKTLGVAGITGAALYFAKMGAEKEKFSPAGLVRDIRNQAKKK